MVEISGGSKLEAALKEIARKLETAAHLQVGFMEGATYPDGTPVPLVAAIQEFGAPSRNIPPRPFFRNMIAAKSSEWPDAIREGLKDNDYDAKRTLDVLGEGVEGQLRQSIRDTNSPPLADSTIARKGFAKPLIDTGVLINSITHKVD